MSQARFAMRAAWSTLVVMLAQSCGPESNQSIGEAEDRMNVIEEQLAGGGDNTALCLDYLGLCEQGIGLCLVGDNAATYPSFCSGLGARCRATVDLYCVVAQVDGGRPASDAGARPVDGGASSVDAGAPSGDAGPSRVDAGAPSSDAGPAQVDAGVPSGDAGPSRADAGTPLVDAGAPSGDGGISPRDGGAPLPDAGTTFPPDAGPGSVSGATYFVAPGGSSSNPGTMARPFATIQDAYRLVAAGDIIYLRGGRYDVSQSITLTKSGSEGRPIRLWAYPGEKPVLDAAAVTAEPSWVIRLSGASWWHIKGLEIRNNPHGGAIYLGTNANKNIIEANDTHHNGRLSSWAGTGIVLYGNPSGNLILNNDSHDNKDIDEGDADGFAFGTTGSGNVVRGNRAWNNSDDGFDFFNTNDNTTGGVQSVENNWAWRNGYDANHVPYPQGNGNGFKLGGTRGNTTGTSGGHRVQNNVSWGNLTAGFTENSANVPLAVYNNTAWNNATNNFEFWTTLHTLRNNVSLGAYGTSKGPSTFNSWTLPVTVTSADFESTDDTCARGPRQPEGALPRCAFLRLAAGSDCLDKGTPLGLPFTGSAPDLGAFERDP
jgi:hypothetical protein